MDLPSGPVKISALAFGSHLEVAAEAGSLQPWRAGKPRPSQSRQSAHIPIPGAPLPPGDAKEDLLGKGLFERKDKGFPPLLVSSPLFMDVLTKARVSSLHFRLFILKGRLEITVILIPALSF